MVGRRALATIGLAAAMSGVTVAPAVAARAVAAPGARTSGMGAIGLKPRAGQWWFTSWKILPRVWPLTQGAGVTVAVLDSGVQASVPDLRGAVLSGGDVTGQLTDGEKDFNTAGSGHGTMMAVLIAGQGFGTGILGVAPRAKILPVVVNAGVSDGTAAPGAMAAGIRYAADHGAQVIDVSQEYPSASAAGCDPAEQAAVAYALARDVIVIAAAGDTDLTGSRPSEPASCAGVLAVAAVQPNRSLWPGNARQPYITVVNPGADLITSGRDGQLVSAVSGTRAASALAAGAVALIRSRYPALRWQQVIQRLTGTALRNGGKLPNDSSGYGILRLSAAVNASAFPVPASAPDPVYAKFQAWLATPQGRAVSRQLGVPRSGASGASRASGASAASGGSADAVLIAVLAPLAVVMVVIMAGLAVRGRGRLWHWLSRDGRRPRRGGSRRRRGPDPASEPDERLPIPDFSSDRARADDYFPLGESTPYRVPPYSPAPGGDTAPFSGTSLLSSPDDRFF